MIQTKSDYLRFIRKDFEVQRMKHPLAAKFTYGENWAMYKYMKNLRKLEYYKNKTSYIGKLLFIYYQFIHRKQCLKYDIYISPNIVEEGFNLVHPGFRRIDKVVKKNREKLYSVANGSFWQEGTGCRLQLHRSWR